MSRTCIKEETIRDSTQKAMKKLGTFKPEYLPLIRIYSGMRADYERLHREYVNGGFKCAEPSGAGGDKKSPLVATLEALRKDILQYSDRLMLNPKALLDGKLAPQKKESPLIAALREIEED